MAREIEANCRNEAEAASDRVLKLVNDKLALAAKERAEIDAKNNERWGKTVITMLVVGGLAIFGIGISVGLGVLALSDVIQFVK